MHFRWQADRRFRIARRARISDHRSHLTMGALMRAHGSGRAIATALFSITAVLAAPGGALGAWMQVSRAPSPAAPAPASPDGEWPRHYTAPDGAAVVVYEPQVAEWIDQKRMTVYAAVSHTPRDAAAAIIGTILVEADTRVSVEQRLVDFSSLRIIESNFPGASRDQAAAAVAAVKSSIPLGERVIALDRVLAQIDASSIRPKNIEGVKADPPAVFFSTRPAIIVNLDGEPIWSPIPNNDLRFAVNTNWDLFEHAPSKTFYLRHERLWLKADAVRGPWVKAVSLPSSF